MLTLLLVFNTALLLLANIVLAVSGTRNGGFKGNIRGTLERLDSEYTSRRLQRAVRMYTDSTLSRLNMMERIELIFIDKSNIRHYIPFMNFYTLISFMALIFFALLKPVYSVLLFLPSAAIISLIFAMLPLFALDLLSRYNSEVIRRRLAEFISVLNRWCSVKEDIFYAFEKSVESGIGEPLRTFIRDMVIQVNRGIEPVEALDMLQLKVDNIQFRDFVVNVKQNIRFRGNIPKLLTNLENQFYKIEEEYNRRRISTYKDRLLIYGIMFAVLFLAYFFIKSSPRIEDFYLATYQGKGLLTLFCVLYACGTYISLGITRFNH